jgi:hypothetical protein
MELLLLEQNILGYTCRRPFCHSKPEIQQDHRGRGMPTLTGEEVTIRREEDGVMVVSKRKL